MAALRQEQDKQGVALRLAGDKAMLYRVRILGSQDTLYDDKGSHYFFKCYIQGTVDFICGNARSLFQVLVSFIFFFFNIDSVQVSLLTPDLLFVINNISIRLFCLLRLNTIRKK